MTERTTVHGLKVATPLYNFINNEVLPGTGIDQAAYWKGFDEIVSTLAPKTPPCWPSATAFSWKWTPGTKPTPAPSPTWPPTKNF